MIHNHEDFTKTIRDIRDKLSAIEKYVEGFSDSNNPFHTDDKEMPKPPQLLPLPREKWGIEVLNISDTITDTDCELQLLQEMSFLDGMKVGEWHHTKTFSLFISEGWTKALPHLHNLYSPENNIGLYGLMDILMSPHKYANKESDALNRYLLINCPWRYPGRTIQFFQPEQDNLVFYVDISGDWMYYYNGFCATSTAKNRSPFKYPCCPINRVSDEIHDMPFGQHFKETINYKSHISLFLKNLGDLPPLMTKKDGLLCQLGLLDKRGDITDFANYFRSKGFRNSLIKYCLFDIKTKNDLIQLLGFPSPTFVEKDKRIGFTNGIDVNKLFGPELNFEFLSHYVSGVENANSVWDTLKETLWYLQATMICSYYHDINKDGWHWLADELQIPAHERKKLGMPLQSSPKKYKYVEELLKNTQNNFTDSGVYLTYEEKRNRDIARPLDQRLSLPMMPWPAVKEYFNL